MSLQRHRLMWFTPQQSNDQKSWQRHTGDLVSLPKTVYNLLPDIQKQTKMVWKVENKLHVLLHPT